MKCYWCQNEIYSTHYDSKGNKYCGNQCSQRGENPMSEDSIKDITRATAEAGSEIFNSLSDANKGIFIICGYIGIVFLCAYFSDEPLVIIKNYAMVFILLGISVPFFIKSFKVIFFYFFLFFSTLAIILGLYIIYNEWYLQKADMRSGILFLGNLVPVILSFILLLLAIFDLIRTKRNIKRDADLHSK